MCRFRDEQDRLLQAHGAELLRQQKHQVFRLPSGRNFVRASTPSDHRADMNALAELRTILGVHVERGIAGERRERVQRQAVAHVARTSLSDAPDQNKAALRKQLMALVPPVRVPKKRFNRNGIRVLA